MVVKTVTTSYYKKQQVQFLKWLVDVRKNIKITYPSSYPMTNAKTYWWLLKIFYNGKKVPIISPLLIDDKDTSDFVEKANSFNNYFASQRAPLKNHGKTYTTRTKLSLIKFENKDIINIIRFINKARIQESFGSRDWNGSTSINVSCATHKERLRREKFWCFFSKMLLKQHFKSKFNP